MKNKTKTTAYQILTDKNSDLYNRCQKELEEGKKRNNIWNKIRITDLYIDYCFDNINNTLHHVPGAENVGYGDLYGPYAHNSIFMKYEDMNITVRKDFIEKDGEPILFLECSTPKTFFKKREPLYLTQIVNDYKAIKVK